MWTLNGILTPGIYMSKKFMHTEKIRKKTFLQTRTLFSEMLIYLLMMKEENKDRCSGDYWGGWLPNETQCRWEEENRTVVQNRNITIFNEFLF